jgi:hypothetical protein
MPSEVGLLSYRGSILMFKKEVRSTVLNLFQVVIQVRARFAQSHFRRLSYYLLFHPHNERTLRETNHPSYS